MMPPAGCIYCGHLNDSPLRKLNRQRSEECADRVACRRRVIQAQIKKQVRERQAAKRAGCFLCGAAGVPMVRQLGGRQLLQCMDPGACRRRQGVG